MAFAIETSGLTRRYGRLDVVESLDLRVPAGSVFALVGPNGAGKTTTIKMLMNLVSPTRGSVSMTRDGSLERDLEVPNFPLSVPSRASSAP